VGEVDPAAAAAAAVGECEVQTSPLLDGLVSRQPLLLVANVDDLLDELARWVLLYMIGVFLQLKLLPEVLFDNLLRMSELRRRRETHRVCHPGKVAGVENATRVRGCTRGVKGGQ
jgi:hypothetical protein